LKLSNELMVCTEKLISYISSQLSIEESTIEIVLDSEMDFLESKNLLSEHPSVEPTEPIYIDNNELIQFIVADTKLDVSLISDVLDKEMEYLEQLGIAQPF
jgi:hypothetical protein